MKKYAIILLAVVLMAVTASAETIFVADNAGLLSQTEAAQLEREFSQISGQYGFAMAAATVNSFDGMDAADYAAACYSDGDYGNDGILLLISEQEGQWYLYSSGICSVALSNDDLAKIGEKLTENLKKGSYFEAMQTYRQEALEPICRALDARGADAKNLHHTQNRYILLGMAGGLVVGILVAVWLGKLAGNPIKRRIPASNENGENG